MGFTEKVDAMLGGRKKEVVRRNGVIALILLALLDCACVVFLREVPSMTKHEIPPAKWTAAGILAGLPRFGDDTIDCLLLFVVRVIVLAVLTCVAVRLGTADLSGIKTNEASVEPLLINGPGASETCPPCEPQTSTAAKQTRNEVKKEHLESHELKQRAEQKKNFAIAAVFIVSTAAQCFVGVKCIGFTGYWPDYPEVMTIQGTLMGLSVLFINVEACPPARRPVTFAATAVTATHEPCRAWAATVAGVAH